MRTLTRRFHPKNSLEARAPTKESLGRLSRLPYNRTLGPTGQRNPQELKMDPHAHVWRGATLATMVNGQYNLIPDGAIATLGDRLTFVGPSRNLSPDPNVPETNLSGHLVTPGLIDCHTHLIFGGNRADEFEQRLQGVTYAEIAARGGGILSTVRHTRAADLETLCQQASGRLRALMAEGVTTVEIKSGYGLDLENELKMLRAARMLGHKHSVQVQTTFLGAHALPPEYREHRADYLTLLTDQLLPAIAEEGLADATDAFCEHIAFTLEETRHVFTASQALNIPVKLHADQLSDSGGAALAASFGALSADHVEFTSDPAIRAMAAAGTVAVLLPGAFYVLRETQLPQIELFRRHGVPMAVATDCNPGTAPVQSLLLMISMACTLFRLTPEEALAGATCHAARALGLHAEIGTLEPGKRADFAVWPLAHPAELAYWVGGIRPTTVVFAGQARR